MGEQNSNHGDLGPVFHVPMPDFSPQNAISLNHVFWSFGSPEDIVSDWEAQYTSHVWRGIIQKLGISVSLTSGYNSPCYHAS